MVLAPVRLFQKFSQHKNNAPLEIIIALYCRSRVAITDIIIIVQNVVVKIIIIQMLFSMFSALDDQLFPWELDEIVLENAVDL